MASFAPLSGTPYYAVIFANHRRDGAVGYGDTASELDALAESQPGFIGLDSARDADGFGITVSYWRTEGAIKAWKNNARHLVAQRMGQDHWYSHYTLRVARIERQYQGPLGRDRVEPRDADGTD